MFTLAALKIKPKHHRILQDIIKAILLKIVTSKTLQLSPQSLVKVPGHYEIAVNVCNLEDLNIFGLEIQKKPGQAWLES